MEIDFSMLDVQKDEPVKIDKKKIASRIAAQIASRSVSAVVVTLIHTNTRTYTKTQKVQLYIGAYVLGSMVAKRAADYVEAEVYELISDVSDFLWVTDEPDLWTPAPLETLIQAIPDQQ